MSWKAVLWDLDGTLLDSKLSIRDTMNHVLREQGAPAFTKAELDALIGTPLRDILLTKVPDPAKVEAMAHRYRAQYNAIGWTTVGLYEGLEALLRELKARGVRMAVVTSKGQSETETLLFDLGVAELFEVIVGDDDVRPLKPDPAPVRAACKQLGLAPSDVVMIGDTTFDIASAVGAGAASIGVQWGIHDSARLHGAGALALVKDAGALRRLLLQNL